MEENCSVLIIGGGAAGLSTAFHLCKSEAIEGQIILLEAEDRLGGRIHTIPKDGNVIELGAQWIHGRGENPLWKFVQEHKVSICNRTITRRTGRTKITRRRK